MHSYEQMEASLLFCPKCREAKPVRKRLLIVLPEGDKFDYVCTVCGSIAGDKIEKAPPELHEQSAMPLRSR
jgi:hypothetical protein